MRTEWWVTGAYRISFTPNPCSESSLNPVSDTRGQSRPHPQTNSCLWPRISLAHRALTSSWHLVLAAYMNTGWNVRSCRDIIKKRFSRKTLEDRTDYRHQAKDSVRQQCGLALFYIWPAPFTLLFCLPPVFCPHVSPFFCTSLHGFV